MRITIVCLLALLTVGCSSTGTVKYNPNVDTTATYTPSYRDTLKSGVKEVKVRNRYHCYRMKRENGGGRCR